MLKVVIFDLDGTIVDSETLNMKVNKALFQEVGIEIADEGYHQFIGLSNRDLWTHLIEKYALSVTVEEMIKRKKSKIIPLWEKKENYSLMEGIEALLERSTVMNIPLALATSSVKESMNAKIESYDLGKYFQEKVCGDQVEKGKPAPDIFLLTAEKMHVQPSECLVFEDAENGVRAAKSAGMKCVGYTNGGKNTQNLEGADMLVEHFEDVSIDDLEKLWMS